MFAAEREETARSQFVLDHEVRQVPPAHPLKNDFFLHELVAYGPAARSVDHIVVPWCRVLSRIADDALSVISHLFRCNRIRYWERQKTWRDDGHERDRAQIDKLQARIALVDMMDDQIRLAIEQTLPGTGNRFEIEMQACAAAAVEELVEQRERLRKRTEIPNDHSQLAFLAQRQLQGVILELGEFPQKCSRTVPKGPPGIGDRDSVATAVQQAQTDLGLEALDGRKDRWL